MVVHVPIITAKWKEVHRSLYAVVGSARFNPSPRLVSVPKIEYFHCKQKPRRQNC